jgi:hypothetical protein
VDNPWTSKTAMKTRQSFIRFSATVSGDFQTFLSKLHRRRTARTPLWISLSKTLSIPMVDLATKILRFK